MCTNNENLHNDIVRDFPEEESPASTLKLLGCQWNRSDDTISSNPIDLNIGACTKRQVLASIASQYDSLGINAPLLNRSRLFIHQLQCNQEIQWDYKNIYKRKGKLLRLK